METFSALLALCVGNSPVNSPHKGQWRGVLMFYVRLNKRLSKQWQGWWFETPSRLLWRHCLEGIFMQSSFTRCEYFCDKIQFVKLNKNIFFMENRLTFRYLWTLVMCTYGHSTRTFLNKWIKATTYEMIGHDMIRNIVWYDITTQ